MDTKYNHKEVEAGKYDFWLKGGFFKSGDKSKEPFSIVIPPPNVTGKLHLGHAWNTTLQDIIIRRKRMQGYDALWLPGMDHAGIATQAKVEERLRSLNIDKYDIGREKFLEYAWAWKEEYASFIRDQWAAMGLSLDYSKERFTLDKGLNEAVNKVFITLYEKGLLYRGERIINWDPMAKTALSNIEVEHKETNGAFYHFLYPFKDMDGGVVVATTRPETMFADQAVMVHPDDERYKDLVGKYVYIAGTDKLIPIIADSYVDMEFGTGCVKVTPAHDPNDFEVGKRHNLAMPLCMNEDGTMNSLAGKYEGLDRFICREKLVNDLKEAGLCLKVEPHVHQVGYSERTHVVVEPRLSKQWFVKMEPLAKQSLDKNTVNFVPKRFLQTFNHWMDTIQDWCVSRQLWWGHSIPAWYKGEELKVQVECPGEGWVQDPDVLDTWFSSALWPFSTLGWPNETEDLKRYYPNSVLVTAYDIIFFWVSRMIFQGLEFTNESPFKDCLIHGLIRDAQGRKMSKSLGNGVDPMDIKEQYGIDTLRYFLATNSAPGLDLRFETEKVTSSWNYINKIWNVARYIKLNTLDINEISIDVKELNEPAKWILSKLNKLIVEVDKNYDKYEFGLVSKDIYNFVWDDFANKYIEITKVDLANNNMMTKHVLRYVLDQVIKLLHPFMPFVTEEIYLQLPHKCASISISDWPCANKDFDFDLENVDTLFELITQVRNVRNENNRPMSRAINFVIEPKNDMIKNFLEESKEYIMRFTNPVDVVFGNPTGEYRIVAKTNYQIHFLMSDLVDAKEEIAKINKELETLENEIKRASGMLANPNFVNKAPEAKVLAEKKKLSDYQERYNTLKEKLESFK